MDLKSWGSLCSLYLWMKISGTDSSSFPWSSLPLVTSWGRRRGSAGGVGAAGFLCDMPELNSDSPPSNSQAAALTPSTCPLKLSWQPGVSTPTPKQTHTYTHTLWGLHPSCNTIPICCTTMPYFPLHALLSFFTLTSHLLLLFVHFPKQKMGNTNSGRFDWSSFVLSLYFLFFFSFVFFVKNV